MPAEKASLASLPTELRDMIWSLTMLSPEPLDAYIATRTAIYERKSGRSSRRIRVLERKRYPGTPPMTALCSSRGEASWARQHEVEQWWQSLGLRDSISRHDRMGWTVRLEVHTIVFAEIETVRYDEHRKAVLTLNRVPGTQNDDRSVTHGICFTWSFEDGYKGRRVVGEELLRSLTDHTSLDSLFTARHSGDTTSVGALASRLEHHIKLWRDENSSDAGDFGHYGQCRACAKRKARAAEHQQTFQLGGQVFVDV
ncbi:hypothetical protein LTR86_007391 [Recurvomyces mirabilis]|nr:hypothetical protein LTR86_007391 [Recurvomyces mirabilis]